MSRFILELALELGKTKAELLSNMSSLELTEWMAYYKVRGEENTREQLDSEAANKLGKMRRGRNRQPYR